MGYGDSYVCGKEEHTHNRRTCGRSYYGRWECGKEEHKHNDNCKYGELTDKTITAKWGANISAQWPKQPQSTWYVSQDIYSSKMQAGIDVMPLGGATFYQYRPSDDAWTQTGNYYVEVVPVKLVRQMLTVQVINWITKILQIIMDGCALQKKTNMQLQALLLMKR